jgi:pimeloyl-ACP methyl ester carboxylesterase
VEETDVSVAGGLLRVVDWGPADAPAVIAAHGITANALSWAAVARELAGSVRLIAPDLRGRAGSAGLPEPYGMGARYPGRVEKVLLVDGGRPLPVPPGIDVDTALLATIGPAMQRLAMTFPTAEDYLAFFRRNPALGRYWSSEIADYVLRDYTGTGSSVNIEAVRADARDMITKPAPSGFPMIAAPRGLQDEETGMYPVALLDGAEMVPDVNHYTILLGGGAAIVAERIRSLATG